LYPVHLPKGRKEAEKVICSNMDFNTFLNTTFPLKEKIKSCKKAKKILDTSAALARKLKINAVPTFILEDGTKITGANIARVKKAMTHLLNYQKN
jgi:protein-disulfide isomerase